MSRRKTAFIGLIGAYGVMWFGGVGHYILMGGPPHNAQWTASLFLLLAGTLIVIPSERKELVDLSIAASIGFAAEVIGVRFGFLFGRYHYTETLGPQFLGVPLVMLSAWMVLISYARQLWMRGKLPLLFEILLAALWMTAIDLVIDPLAAGQLGYWRWLETGAYYGIPIRNFIGWLVVSLIIFGLIGRGASSTCWMHHVGLSIVLFFTAIALSYGMILCGGIGLGLCLIHLCFVVQRREKRPEKLSRNHNLPDRVR